MTDGSTVVDTDEDGTYELISSSDRAFVYLSIPAGYSVPTRVSGTAAAYSPLSPDRHGEATAVFELERLEWSDDAHAMLLLADVQTQTSEEMRRFRSVAVPDIQRTVRELEVAETFGVSCGDIMFDDLSLFPSYERAVRDLSVPFFQVVGNHDLDRNQASDASSVRTFVSHFGPSYRSFDRGAIHYVILDDVHWHGDGYSGRIGDHQLRWLRQDLLRVEPGRPVVVILHIPVLPPPTRARA